MNSWSVIVPVKPWALSKSRLDLPQRVRQSLARAFCADVISTLAQSPNVGCVVVVSESPHPDLPGRSGVEFVREPPPGGGGLNAAVRYAVRHLQATRADSPVLVMPADLPCATPGDLTTSLHRCRALLNEHPRLFARDAAGDGTTLVACAHPSLLDPRYGPMSAADHHTAGYVPISDLPAGLTRDVDTVDDLVEAWYLGVQPHTYAAITGFSGVGDPLCDWPATTGKETRENQRSSSRGNRLFTPV